MTENKRIWLFAERLAHSLAQWSAGAGVLAATGYSFPRELL